MPGFCMTAARAAVVDPGEAGPVIKVLARFGLSLSSVLLTHHHSDHCAGAPELKRFCGCDGDRAAKQRHSGP